MLVTDYRIISGSNVTLLIHPGEALTPPQAEEAVRRALAACGYSPWHSMSIDVFQGSDGALLIASPSQEEQIHIADYLFPFINDYFTD